MSEPQTLCGKCGQFLTRCQCRPLAISQKLPPAPARTPEQIQQELMVAFLRLILEKVMR